MTRSLGALGLLALVTLAHAQPVPAGVDCYTPSGGTLPRCFTTREACLHARDAHESGADPPRCGHWDAAPVCAIVHDSDSAARPGVECAANTSECERSRAHMMEPEVRARRHIASVDACVAIAVERAP